jgi:peptide deformylase
MHPVFENPDLNQLIKDMWETMQNANGCGLAAPQIGQTKQLFIVDSTSVYQLMDTEDREHYFESDDQGLRKHSSTPGLLIIQMNYGMTMKVV